MCVVPAVALLSGAAGPARTEWWRGEDARQVTGQRAFEKSWSGQDRPRSWFPPLTRSQTALQCLGIRGELKTLLLDPVVVVISVRVPLALVSDQRDDAAALVARMHFGR